MTDVIDSLSFSDWDDVRSIYQEGIETGHATFEIKAPSWDDWNLNHINSCRYVFRRDNRILGWAALSSVSERCVYGGVAEISVYVTGNARGEGIGKRLLQSLIQGSEEAGIWTLQAGIFPENVASIGLHKACGFRVVGTRERLGQLDGKWRDVVLLERRSRNIG